MHVPTVCVQLCCRMVEKGFFAEGICAWSMYLGKSPTVTKALTGGVVLSLSPNILSLLVELSCSSHPLSQLKTIKMDNKDILYLNPDASRRERRSAFSFTEWLMAESSVPSLFFASHLQKVQTHNPDWTHYQHLRSTIRYAERLPTVC